MQKKINYFKIYEISDLKDMLYKTVHKNASKIAFKLKDQYGNIQNKTFMDMLKDVEALRNKIN